MNHGLFVGKCDEVSLMLTTMACINFDQVRGSQRNMLAAFKRSIVKIEQFVTVDTKSVPINF